MTIEENKAASLILDKMAAQVGKGRGLEFVEWVMAVKMNIAISRKKTIYGRSENFHLN